MTSAHPEDRLVSCFYSIPLFRARASVLFFSRKNQDRRRDAVRPLLQPPLH